jgi:1-aminocyclopropane-1-carboxylate deaminase
MKSLQSDIQQIFLPEIAEKDIELFIKREDLLHPVISGNKYRKLFYNIQFAKEKGYTELLSFGGAYSNHILATAGAGSEFGFKTIGVIRGDELGEDLEKTLASNPTLKAAHDFGMEFMFVSRSNYKLKETPSFLEDLQKRFPTSYIIPEGGTNDLAVKGCEAILDKSTAVFDFICVAVGTGGTISGIINAAKPNQKVLGFPALKGSFLKSEIEKNIANSTNWDLVLEYHFGGYAKIDEELITFINTFTKNTNILLDPVYTGKMIYGVFDKIKKGSFPKKSKILLIHTGGLQGIKGMNTVLLKKGLPTLIENIHE